MNKFDIMGEIRWYDEAAHKRHEELQIADYPLKSRGEIAIDYPPADVFDHGIREGLFSGYRIGADPFRGKLDTLENMTGPVHIDLIRVIPDYKRFGHESGKTYEEFAQDYYDRCFDFALRHPDRAMLCGIAEYDSSCPWPRDHAFATKKEGYEYFKSVVFGKKVGSGDPATLFQRLKERNLSFADVNMMAHGACLFALHYYFEWGFPHVELERGIGHSCNMQVSMAYLRGAWKQHGRKGTWGMDYSTHNTSFNRLNHYLPNGKRFGGRTESLIVRSCLYAYLAGAFYLLNEGHELTHYVYQEDKSFELSPLGKEMKKFADYTLRSGKDRGVPVTPVAVMLEYCNGYEATTSPFRTPAVWGNCYPYGISDGHITNTYEFLCPGFLLPNHDGDPAFDDVPWNTRQEMLEMQFSGTDMRKYERGFLEPSPCGDCFDVLLDNARGTILAEYPVLLLAGAAAPEAGKLLDYVKEGGTLCAAFNQLPQEILDAAGLVKLPGKGDDWDIDVITYRDGEETSGMRYGFARFEFPEGTQILAKNHRGFPVVAEVPLGKGKILFCTVSYAQDFSGNALLFCWQRALRDEFARHFPVRASVPGLAITCNKTSDGFLLGVFNNRSEKWQGTLELKDGNAKETELAPFEAQLWRVHGKGEWTLDHTVDC